MSRSYRKKAVYSDSSKESKQYANRKYRRANKIRVSQDKEPVLMHELINQYDVCDYRTKMEWCEPTDWCDREWIEKQKELIKRK